MLRHYLIASFRTLWRKKGFTLLNVIGMGIGLAVVLLIFSLLVEFQSFENYHPKGERLARLVIKRINEDGEMLGGYDSRGPFADYINENVSSVEQAARVTRYGEVQLGVYGPNNSLAQNDLHVIESLSLADPAYFEMFDIHVQLGVITEELFTQANKVVLTQETAERLFGSTSAALGKVINIQNLIDAEVIAIIDNYPKNTNFGYDAIIPWANYNEFGFECFDDWGCSTSNMTTWLLLQDNFTQADLVPLARYLLIDRWEYEEDILNRWSFYAQPINKIHSETDWGIGGPAVQFDTTDGMILSGIGLVVLLLACINYINLSTARGFERLKEVGVRRVLGSQRMVIFYQLLAESAIMVGIAFVLSILFGVLLNRLLIANLMPVEVQLLPPTSPTHVAFAFGLYVAVVLLAGAYPALIISGFRPIVALRGKKVQAIGFGAWLRNGLVGFQFVVAQVLVITTLIFYAQRQYISTYDKGFSADAVLAFPLQLGLQDDASELKARFLKIPGVRAASLSNHPPQSHNNWNSDYQLLAFTDDETGELFDDNARMFLIDEDFIPQYGLEIILGRNLLPEEEGRAALVNEQLAKDVGVEPAELLNTQIQVWGDTMTIVGIMATHNDQALRNAPRPIVFHKRPSNFFTLSVTVPLEQATAMLSNFQAEWYKVYPRTVFDYYFVDDRMAELYEQDTRMNRLLGIFSVLAIIIAALGIYGLASYMIFQRRKELSIRKVLGAPVANLLRLLLSRYAVTIVIAAVPAIGLAWYFGNNWLSNFEFRMQLSWYYFASGAVVCLMVVPLIIGQQVWRAANVNPADVLRDE